jgi:transposase InsO family protein
MIGLYDNLSPASRAAIKEAILKKGLEPSMDPKYNSWLKAEHNWNQCVMPYDLWRHGYL